MSVAEPSEREHEGTGPARPVPELLPHEQLGRAFKATQAAVRRVRGRETHRGCEEISNAQYSLLFSLVEHAELSSKDLADQADLTPATVTQMLEGLEADGLVRRTRAEHDRRIVLTSLTERGNELLAQRHAKMEPLWRAALSDFSEDELLTAARVITRLGEFFDSMNR